MTLRRIGFALLAVAVSTALPLAAGQAPAKPNYGPLLGLWAIEVDAGGEYFYLTLEFKLVEGQCEGALSEQGGFFSQLPVADIDWDGTTLKFDFKSPTPPDGVERQVKSEFKYAEGKLAGMMTIPDLGMSVPATGAKK
ncbi:MAG: hypothetical protein FJY82_04310 [Candidatus Aminicenantes bacterium]|nr:hypothetical protein [Candidatus Aminicenantes bacterium]